MSMSTTGSLRSIGSAATGLSHLEGHALVRRRAGALLVEPSLKVLPAAAAPHLVVGAVAGDREQPGGELRLAPVSGEEPERPDESFLGDVVGQGIVVQQVHGQPPHVALVPAHEDLERCDVSTLAAATTCGSGSSIAPSVGIQHRLCQ